MKSNATSFARYHIASFCIAVTIALASSLSAYAQIDADYGKNNKGFRVGVGGGVAVLLTHYNSNPLGGLAVVNVDYDFNPYFSMGVGYQFGMLTGIDNHVNHHYFYIKSADVYNAGDFNIKASVGLFKNFHANTGLMDALKRTYIGVGGGVIQTNITPTVDTNPIHADTYMSFHSQELIPVASFYFGTNIAVPNLFGLDKIEINPNYKFNYVNSLYLDGFQSSPYSHLKGIYNEFSVSVKYKF